jgi:Leucine-rich repeat (LRR) protein
MKSLFNFLITLAFAGFATSCDVTVVKNGSETEEDGDGQIELTVYPENGSVSMRIQAQSVTLNWGDGSQAETHALNGVEQTLTHSFGSSLNPTSIKINGEGIVALSFYKYSNSGYAQTSGVVHELSINRAESLTSLVCNSQQLTALDLAGCPALRQLDCSANLLPALNLESCTALEDLACYNNQLTTLDLSHCPSLKTVDCLGNQLSALDASNHNALKTLVCSWNSLNSLNTGGCSSLVTLACNNNQLNADALNSVYNSLPVRAATDHAVITAINNPGFGASATSIATGKGWTLGN